MLAVEAAMRAYAAKAGEDVEAWGLAACSTTMDYERYPNPEHSRHARGHPAWGSAAAA